MERDNVLRYIVHKMQDGVMSTKTNQQTTAGQELQRIRREARDEFEKGEWFEKLFRKIALNIPELEIKQIWGWKQWPDREKITKLPHMDSGIDMVCELNNGSLVAIQAKCRADDSHISRNEIDSFLSISAGQPFDVRWIIVTCDLGKNVRTAIDTAAGPPIKCIDFYRFADTPIDKNRSIYTTHPPRHIWDSQQKAIDNVINRFKDKDTDRGQLIMACGTVCSDSTSGGRGEENDDISISDLECVVTTDPEEIASHMKTINSWNVVFCTYQSLKKVCEAQQNHEAPDFDLILADEAHRTTGIEKKSDRDFQMVHHKVKGKRRLYMTATPRVYTIQSKKAMQKKGWNVFDMEDEERFGTILHRLTFKEAVDAGILSDYRVIITPKFDAHELWDTCIRLHTNSDKTHTMKYEDMERLLGVAFAINGISGSRTVNEKLPRILGFANSRWRSKIYSDILSTNELHGIVSRRMGLVNNDNDATRIDSKTSETDTTTNMDTKHNHVYTPHTIQHLDGTNTAYIRNKALHNLNNANMDNPYMINNVKLFTEGVDVPALNAVAFIDSRNSTVDLVQAVGRVMRKSPGKSLGYIIVPGAISESQITDKLSLDEIGLSDKDEWHALHRVFSALQAHDSRFPEDPARFIDIGTPPDSPPLPNGRIVKGIQDVLDIEQLTEKFYTTVVAGSGIARPGQMVTDDIEWRAGIVGKAFDNYEGLRDKLAEELKLESDKATCKIAALLIINACLLYSRLYNKIGDIKTLSEINGSNEPLEILSTQWKKILEKDYAPVFEPALTVLDALPKNNKKIKDKIYGILDAAHNTADSLNELGYDHAGPLYHKILGTATSDSANYTDNISALMLARLVFSSNFINWSDHTQIKKLKIMDPACGTGTLLMATLKTIKDRTGYNTMTPEQQEQFHKQLVEDSIYGLDINRHAIQLAACNLTLGAPTVDYKRMNLHTMKHGPQSDRTVKAGSIEMLQDANVHNIQKTLIQPLKDSTRHGMTHIDKSEKKFPTTNLDVIIMNPPFGSNQHRSRKYEADKVKLMQKNELTIRDNLKYLDPDASNAISSTSISTFFTPLADKLLNPTYGTLARVMAVTECTSVSVVGLRKFLASRFHIKYIITSHDPKHLNFSYKTEIHECLIVCSRHTSKSRLPTKFISLRKMPTNVKEAIDSIDDIINNNHKEWGVGVNWPAERVEAGDWTPVQWYDVTLANTILNLESSEFLEPIGSRYDIGPAGSQLRGNVYESCEKGDVDAVKTFWSISAKLRKTINGEPESWRKPTSNNAKKLWNRRSNLLISEKFDTIGGRLTALYSNTPSIGSGWIPVAVKDEHIAKALAVWLNSTPVRMMLLNRRSKKLTYPNWSLTHLREIKIPKPDNVGWSALRAAYDQICDTELLTMKDQVNDIARHIIDEAAAVCLNIEPFIIQQWRDRLSKEPTITNKRLGNITL